MTDNEKVKQALHDASEAMLFPGSNYRVKAVPYARVLEVLTEIENADAPADARTVQILVRDDTPTDDEREAWAAEIRQADRLLPTGALDHGEWSRRLADHLLSRFRRTEVPTPPRTGSRPEATPADSTPDRGSSSRASKPKRSGTGIRHARRSAPNWRGRTWRAGALSISPATPTSCSASRTRRRHDRLDPF